MSASTFPPGSASPVLGTCQTLREYAQAKQYGGRSVTGLHTVPARRVIRLPIHRPADHAPTPRGPDLSSCGWHSLLHPGFRAGKDHLPSCTQGKYQSPRHTQTCTCRRPGRYSFLQLLRFSYNAASLPVGCIWLTP